MKIVESVQDWTGNVLTSFTVGDWAVEKDDYFDDQLPLTLRTLPFKDGIEKKIRLFELHNGTSTTVTPAQMSVTLAADPVRCRAGSLPCWIVTIKKPAGTDRYWFEKKEPNLLVKMETADGRKRLLIGRARWTYWDHRIPRPKILN
jgi:hypothetical protein